MRNCKHLKSLNLSGCSSLTDRIHEEISIHCQRIEILELAEMPQLTMDNFYKISSLSLIKKLNISYSSIENEVLQRFLSIRPENIKNLEWLNMDSCHFLNKETIVFLCYFKLPPRLKYLNLAHNMNFVESDIWKLVFGFETLVDLVVETHLLGEQIREKLAWNRIFAEQQMNSAFMSISK